MKTTNFQFVLLVALGVLLGGLGTYVLTASNADAQTGRQFNECTALTLHRHDGAAFANPQWNPNTIRIRRGWTVVGGGGGTRTYAVVCR